MFDLEVWKAKLEAHRAKFGNGRFIPCSCGKCGLIYDTKLDLAIADFIGPHDKEQPIPDNARQAYMERVCRALNKEEDAQ